MKAVNYNCKTIYFRNVINIQSRLAIYNYIYKRAHHDLLSLTHQTLLSLRDLACFSLLRYVTIVNTTMNIESVHVAVTRRLEATLDEHPLLYNRIIQVAFEVSFSKQKFTRVQLETIFHNSIYLRNVLDPYDISSAVDQSTIMNLLTAQFLKKKYPYVEYSVNTTPTKMINKAQLTVEINRIIQDNELKCKNAFCDLSVDGVAYDLKHTKNICNTLNHIYILPFTPGMVFKFKQSLIILQTICKKNMDKGNKLHKAFYQKYDNKIDELNLLLNQKDNSLFPGILENWNEFIFKTLCERPSNFSMPIFVITSNVPLSTVLNEEKAAYNFREYDVIEGIIHYKSVKKGLEIISHRKGLSEHTRKVLTGDLDTIFSRQDDFPIDGPD